MNFVLELGHLPNLLRVRPPALAEHMNRVVLVAKKRA